MKDGAVFVIWLASVGGYIANIVKLAGALSVGGMEILRVIGIFIPPAGVVLGFI